MINTQVKLTERQLAILHSTFSPDKPEKVSSLVKLAVTLVCSQSISRGFSPHFDLVSEAKAYLKNNGFCLCQIKDSEPPDLEELESSVAEELSRLRAEETSDEN